MFIWAITGALAGPPIHAQVPVPAQAFGDPFEHCAVFVETKRGRRQKEEVESADGKVGLRCEREARKKVRVCLLLDPGNWPSRFPEELSCRVGERDYHIHPYVGWNPYWKLGEPLEVATTPTTHHALSFRLPEEWVDAHPAVPDTLFSCSIPKVGRLSVDTKPGLPFGPHTCVLVDSDGQERQLVVTVNEVPPLPTPAE